jgi:hypothetical protein
LIRIKLAASALRSFHAGAASDPGGSGASREFAIAFKCP